MNTFPGSHLSRLRRRPCCGYMSRQGGVLLGRVKGGTRAPHTGILQPRSVHFLLQSELPPGGKPQCRTVVPCTARWPPPERSQNHRRCPTCLHVVLQHDQSRECPLQPAWVSCGLKNSISVRENMIPIFSFMIGVSQRVKSEKGKPFMPLGFSAYSGLSRF